MGHVHTWIPNKRKFVFDSISIETHALNLLSFFEKIIEGQLLGDAPSKEQMPAFKTTSYR
jgi:hypothetical protein